MEKPIDVLQKVGGRSFGSDKNRTLCVAGAGRDCSGGGAAFGFFCSPAGTGPASGSSNTSKTAGHTATCSGAASFRLSGAAPCRPGGRSTWPSDLQRELQLLSRI